MPPRDHEPQAEPPRNPRDADFLGAVLREFREGVALGIERTMANDIRSEFRAFLEEYFGLLTKEETAALLGVSARTIETLWADQSIPKDTRLGSKLPRVWLPALKECLAASRIKARDRKAVPRLEIVDTGRKTHRAA